MSDNYLYDELQKCAACGVLAKTTQLRTYNTDPDSIGYVCRDHTACLARMRRTAEATIGTIRSAYTDLIRLREISLTPETPTQRARYRAAELEHRCQSRYTFAGIPHIRCELWRGHLGNRWYPHHQSGEYRWTDQGAHVGRGQEAAG